MTADELRRKLAAAPRTTGDEAAAAVAAIVRDGVEGAELLFIKRAEREGDPWSGHLAFPGGKREPTDASLVDTAIRETHEEVGVELKKSQLAARLEDVNARTTSYRVAHLTFVLDEPEVALRLNAEVAATLWVPVDRLARREGAGVYHFERGPISIDLPCIYLGEYVLWGMTYRMVMQLLEAVALGEKGA